MRPTGYSFIRLVDENLAPEQTTLFALRVDDFSGREWALPGSARKAGTRGEADQEEGPVDLPLCFAGFAMEGEPRLSRTAETAKRRKVQVKKATGGLFQQPDSSGILWSCAVLGGEYGFFAARVPDGQRGKPAGVQLLGALHGVREYVLAQPAAVSGDGGAAALEGIAIPVVSLATVRRAGFFYTPHLEWARHGRAHVRYRGRGVGNVSHQLGHGRESSVLAKCPQRARVKAGLSRSRMAYTDSRHRDTHKHTIP